MAVKLINSKTQKLNKQLLILKTFFYFQVSMCLKSIKVTIFKIITSRKYPTKNLNDRRQG